MYLAALDVLSRGTLVACGRLRPQRSSVSRYPSVQPTLQRLPHVYTLTLHVDLKHSPQAKLGYRYRGYRLGLHKATGTMCLGIVSNACGIQMTNSGTAFQIKSQMPKDWKRFGHILVLSTRYSKLTRDFNLDQVGISTHFNSKEKKRNFNQLIGASAKLNAPQNACTRLEE